MSASDDSGAAPSTTQTKKPLPPRTATSPLACRKSHSPTRVASTETSDATSRHADPA